MRYRDCLLKRKAGLVIPQLSFPSPCGSLVGDTVKINNRQYMQPAKYPQRLKRVAENSKWRRTDCLTKHLYNLHLFFRRGSRRVNFNIGGTKFQTFPETLQRDNTTKLSDESFLKLHYDQETDEYFFDRDPEMFLAVLNYLRSGKLHLPATVCGPVVKEELDFWGMEDSCIEACCWTGYNGWTSTVEALEQLEKDRKQHVNHEPGDTAPWSIRLKHRTWMFLTSHNSSLPAKIYGWISLCFVMVSIFSFCAATHPYFKVHPNSNSSTTNTTSNTTTDDSYTDISHSFAMDTERYPALFYIDIICLTFFTTEYILRFICAPRKFKFVFSPLTIIDLLAILPDYIEFIVYAADPEALQKGTFINFMPLLRLMRAFRIFRLIRHVPGLWIMFYTLKASFKDLFLMLVFLLVGMLLSSALIFYTDDKETFTSIPHGFWWAVVTMTTVGYGDMYPKTTLGRIVGSFTAVCGVLLIGFTIPALVNNFSLYYQHVEYAIQKENASKGQNHDENKNKDKSPCNKRPYRDPNLFHEHLPLYQQTAKSNGTNGEHV